MMSSTVGFYSAIIRSLNDRTIWMSILKPKTFMDVKCKSYYDYFPRWILIHCFEFKIIIIESLNDYRFQMNFDDRNSRNPESYIVHLHKFTYFIWES